MHSPHGKDTKQPTAHGFRQVVGCMVHYPHKDLKWQQFSLFSWHWLIFFDVDRNCRIPSTDESVFGGATMNFLGVVQSVEIERLRCVLWKPTARMGFS